MKRNRQIACAISAALSACAYARAYADAQPLAAADAQPLATDAQTTPGAPPTAAATAAPNEGLQEVTVTATRRAESVQDVPLTVQAITGAQLEQLNVQNEYDLFKYTPNVTYSGNGPGTGNIFMRGLGGIGSGNQSQSTTAAFPNVAVYLDEQSMEFPARNVDVYVVDMQRIEVLEGPQGTLFGGGAQAGAIRYITNKPNLNDTTGEVNAGYGVTAHGDHNNELNAVLNVPIIPGTFALRAVIFSDHQGGYIDNVPSTISYLPGTPEVTMGGNPTANNAALVNTNTNPVDYGGARLSALWKVNDNWSLLLQQNYQDMEADGYFYAYPFASDGAALGPYELTAFTPAHNNDRYESTAWTVNGSVANFLSVVYTGSYMVRHIDGQQDYSNYLRSKVGSFYGCIGPGAGYFNPANFPTLTGRPLQCYPPVGDWQDVVQNQHQSHELRVSTPTDNRLRGLFGAYWEKFNIDDEMNFNYLPPPQCSPQNLAAYMAGGPDCLSAVGPVPGAFATEPQLREGTNTAFGEDDQRGYKQTALFTSIDFDIIPNTLTLTGGTRWYSYEEYEYGSEYYTESTSSGYVLDHANGVCTAKGLCGFPINLHKGEHGFRSRANLTWHITEDLMAYYTWSQGFRPGGFNRTSSLPNGEISLAAEAPFSTTKDTDQYLKPAGYNSDNLINNEVGFKSEFLDHRLLFNVSAYYMQWNNIILSLFDPVHLGNTTFNVNGPSYNIKGFEVQFAARLWEGLSVDGSSSVNSPSQSNTPCLISSGVVPGIKKTANNPTPAGDCITQIVPAGTATPEPYTNPFGILGTSPAFSPPWMFNVRVRYDWTLANSWKPFAWIGASHIGPMSNEPASFPSGYATNEMPPTGWPTTTLLRYEIPGYTTYDAAIGVVKDQWSAQVSSSNLTNAYGPSNISSGQFIESVIPLRPRVIMFQMSYRF
jgi:iron complex outermembrane recepter protein